jgi:hypothetical protein
MNARPLPPRIRLWCTLLGPFAGTVLLLAACSNSDAADIKTTVPPAQTPPAELAVTRGAPSCYVRQFPAADIPIVRGYRLATGAPLPEGLAPSVKNVRFLGGGQSRVLEAEICFTAEPAVAGGRVDAQLELRLYNADSERLSLNDRIQPVRTLRFTQVVVVR